MRSSKQLAVTSLIFIYFYLNLLRGRRNIHWLIKYLYSLLSLIYINENNFVETQDQQTFYKSSIIESSICLLLRDTKIVDLETFNFYALATS